MVETINKDSFISIVTDIKKDIKSTRFKIFENANRELLCLYFRLGKVIDDNWKYGNSFINQLSIELRLEFPNMKGFSTRNLRRMRIFYNEYKYIQNWPLSVANLPWTHNCILIDRIKEYDNETIGLLLCREKDKLSVEWSLEGVNNPIGVSSYEIKNYIPKDILEKLPTEDDINMHINIDEKKN